MKIDQLFKRDIYRPINGVVKADEIDASSVWQELDEFVVTKELTRHMTDLIGVILTTMEAEVAPAGKNGVWISGFFGCGKSHFLKVLSYLLENGEHEHEGQKKSAVKFFEDKLDDPLLFADLKKAVSKSTSSILFNIDSKADHRGGRDALLQVFLKVLNEKQGYSGDHPHIAHMERFLDDSQKLVDFQEAFKEESGELWLESRDGWEFHRDEIIQSLINVLGQSKESAAALVDGGEENFSLTVENFAKWVKSFLDKSGDDSRIMFLVDEVGQFVGSDTHLMLNLQTITEELGTLCKGRAWVVVTSQEDLDAVLGDMKLDKQHDFSKIQGRFITRLSLSSANVDEVIKTRLLEKTTEAEVPLRSSFSGKEDILKNQLSFVNAGMSFKEYLDEADFMGCYPFAAYQFDLVQRVFESIRKAGATGLHLSHGERSTLDAFQSAAKLLGSKEIGVLVPFYNFYPSVEGFLDTTVKRTIEKAGENHALEPFDSTLLKVLFLIRYVEELPGSVENLTTLCIGEIDADKLALRKKIEESLGRLEGQTLVSRNGELYFFLTNEERDITREIKNEAIQSGAEERELGKLIFEEILGDHRKHNYPKTSRDFPYNRICDEHFVGNRQEGIMEVEVVSPLCEEFHLFSGSPEYCCSHTNRLPDRVLVCLPDSKSLGRELREYLQTEAYVRTKHTGSLPESTKRILRDRNDDNRTRRHRINAELKEMLAGAEVYVSGTPREVTSSNPKEALSSAFDYLIENTYSKMGYINCIHPNPKREIQTMLRANDVEQATPTDEDPRGNTKALADLRDYIQLCEHTHQKVVLRNLIETRYGKRPYGWPEFEIVILIARLAVTKEISLSVNSAPLSLEQAYDHLVSSSKQRKVIITQRQIADQAIMKKARDLGKHLFSEQGPAAEDALFHFLKAKLEEWKKDLLQYEPLAKTGDYPGLSEIEEALQRLRALVNEDNSLVFLKRFVEYKNDFGNIADDYHDLKGFYSNQKHSWGNLRKAVTELTQNKLQLQAHEAAGPALARMEEILGLKDPYQAIQEAARHIPVAQEVNKELVSSARVPAVEAIQGHLDTIEKELDSVSADNSLRSTATKGLRNLLSTAKQSSSIAHITQAADTAVDAFNRALVAIENRPIDPVDLVNAKPVPAVKRRRTVNSRNHCSSDFIETPEQIEDFLSSLRKELQQAVDAGERVQIK